MSFKSEGQIKIFPDKQKLRELVTHRPGLQEMLKEALHSELKGHGTGTWGLMEKEGSQ